MAAASGGNSSSASTGGGSVSGNIGQGPAVTTPGGNVNPTSNISDFTSAITDQLMQSAGAVSSNANTQTDQYAAIAAQQQAQGAKTDVGLTANYQGNSQLASINAGSQQAGAMAAHSGIASNNGVLLSIQEASKVQLNQLNDAYTAAITANDQKTADAVSAIQTQALAAKATALNQVFQNLTSIASTANQQQQTQIAQQTQNFAEQQAVANIGLQFGLNLPPGTTLQQAVALASPKASQAQQASLSLTFAQTYAAQESAAQAAAGIAALMQPGQATGWAGTYTQNLINNTPTSLTQAANMEAQIKAQGGTAGQEFSDAVQGQVNTFYSGGNIPGMGSATSTVPNSNALQAFFSGQLGQLMQGTNASNQVTTWYNAISQLQQQYTSPGSGLGKLASSQQQKISAEALIDAQNSYINNSANGLQRGTSLLDAIKGGWNSILSQGPTAEQVVPNATLPVAPGVGVGL